MAEPKPGLMTRLARRMGMKAAVGPTDISPLLSTGGGWFNILRENVTGGWQRGMKVESPECLLAFGAIYSCVSLIAGDISKLRIKLVQLVDGIWTETQSPAFSPVLRKPNRYQTRIQFLNAWLCSKLLWGNSYVLKERDARGVVVALYVLNPQLVRTLVTSDGGVYYQLSGDVLSGFAQGATIPATEIIHDRAICPFHPLIGMGPLHAAAISASQGRSIQNNSSVFFENMSRPSGQLTSVNHITDETAERLKRDFEARFSGANIGKLLVAGDGLKYEAMTMPAQQAQLIEQLKFTGEDVCRPFLVPAYKVGLGSPPTFNNIGQLAQEYYSTCLQAYIEAIEVLLDEGLALPSNYGTELDVEALLRMDPLARADRTQKLMQAGAMSPDEARQPENLPPLPNGAGKVPFMQDQNFPVTVLAKRTDVMPAATPAMPTPSPASPAPAAAPAPSKELEEEVISVRAVEEAADFFDRIIKGLVDVETA
jgi:HK97 family phage portal protein